MSEALLEISDLHVAYGQVEAVRGVSLSVPTGKIATVIGPNGAGKTTLLGAVMGLLPSRGAVRFAGERIDGRETETLVRLGMTLVPEKRELFAEMTVLENLELGGFSRRRSGESRAALLNTLEEVFTLFPRLKERQPQLAGTLSGGERQMLAVGRALMAKPKLLLLDEPSLGLAPLITRDILATISKLRETGLSVLLIEQNARAALQTADYGYVLETGELGLEGKAQDLLHDERVIATYLGKR
jgi:branched-chain amino acid transport system ATP-binding protein